MKRTSVRDVPRPSSPSPAPFRLRGCVAQVVLISILRSSAESIEKTPTNTPAGGNVSKLSGGKLGGISSGRGLI